MTSLTLKLPTIPSLISDDVQVSEPLCRYLIRVKLSALGGRSMRGIERAFAAVLLLAAIGGAAVFASESGRGLAAAVHLAAPPDQHLAAPGSVLVAPTASAGHSRPVSRPAALPAPVTAPRAVSRKTTPVRPATLVPARTEPRRAPQTPTRAPSPVPAPAPVAAPADAP